MYQKVENVLPHVKDLLEPFHLLIRCLIVEVRDRIK